MVLTIKDSIFSIGDNSLRYGIVPWDSEIFGFPIVEITDIEVNNIGNFDTFITHFEESVRAVNAKMICVKVPIREREIFKRLLWKGYLFIEETVKLYIGDISRADVDWHYIKYPLSKAKKEDIPALQKIAFETFKNDRFHLDKNFPGSKASERYAYWVNNSYQSGEDIFVVKVDGRPAGFSIISKSGNSAYLNLIGVDSEYKDKGIGANLLAATCQHLVENGLKDITTTVSLNNIAAVNLYAKFTFKFKDPIYVLHKWL